MGGEVSYPLLFSALLCNESFTSVIKLKMVIEGGVCGRASQCMASCSACLLGFEELRSAGDGMGRISTPRSCSFLLLFVLPRLSLSIRALHRKVWNGLVPRVMECLMCSIQ